MHIVACNKTSTFRTNKKRLWRTKLWCNRSPICPFYTRKEMQKTEIFRLKSGGVVFYTRSPYTRVYRVWSEFQYKRSPPKDQSLSTREFSPGCEQETPSDQRTSRHLLPGWHRATEKPLTAASTRAQQRCVHAGRRSSSCRECRPTSRRPRGCS